jgi:hypothetical protein
VRLLLQLALKPLHFVYEVSDGTTEDVDCLGQLSGVTASVGVRMDPAGESIGRIDGASDVPHGHGQKVGRGCKLGHWVGLRCPNLDCEWGWGTYWPFAPVGGDSR